MSKNIQFRDCVHRHVAGPTEAAIRAAVTGDHCAPGTAPMDAGSLFYGVAQVLGESAFSALWSAFQKPVPKPNPRDFAAFLAGQSQGRKIPALADLARFDLAYGLAAQPGPAPSIGSCCLPEALLRAHPDMLMRFQPGWRYLKLDWPVHHLLSDAITEEALWALEDETVHLRVAPNGMGVGIRELEPADHALQSALRDGQRLSDATMIAHAIEPTLDPIPIVIGLVEAGAILDVVLHPAPKPNPATDLRD